MADGPVWAGRLEHLGGPAHVVGAEHHVNLGGTLAHQAGVLLGQAAGDSDLHPGPALLLGPQMAEVAVQLVVSVLPDAARVEEHDVGLPEIVGGLHAISFEQAGEPLGVVLVHLTPEGADQELAGHTLRLLSAPPVPQMVACATRREPSADAAPSAGPLPSLVADSPSADALASAGFLCMRSSTERRIAVRLSPSISMSANVGMHTRSTLDGVRY